MKSFAAKSDFKSLTYQTSQDSRDGAALQRPLRAHQPPPSPSGGCLRSSIATAETARRMKLSGQLAAEVVKEAAEGARSATQFARSGVPGEDGMAGGI